MTALGALQAGLYQAENATIAGLGVRWRRLADAQAYLDRLVEQAWFFERWPHFVRCTVERRSSGARWSCCRHLDADGPGGVATEGAVLIAGPLTQPVVLHELAHLLRPPDEGHTRRYAETMLALVRAEMGFVAFAELYQALVATPGFYDLRRDVPTIQT